MENLFPAIVVIIGIVASIISSSKKEKEKQAAEERRKAAAAARVQAAQQKKTSSTTREGKPGMERPSIPIASMPSQPITPTVHPHLQPDCETHDQPGSLGVTSMEGRDPCHEEDLTLTRSFAEAPQPEGGLSFSWTGDSMVRAVVMQEVLTRPCQRHAR